MNHLHMKIDIIAIAKYQLLETKWDKFYIWESAHCLQVNRRHFINAKE